MGFRKEIENRKKILEVKNKIKGVVESVTKTVQSTVDTFSANIDTLATKQFKKDVYGRAIDYVEALIVESNLETTTEIKISVNELEGFKSVAEIIASLSGDETAKALSEKENYVKTVFDVLVNHFSEEQEDLEAEITADTIILRIKEEPAEAETEKEEEVKTEKETTEE